MLAHNLDGRSVVVARMENVFIDSEREHLERTKPFPILGLPAELQTAILDHLLRPEHLAQTCLVSKQLRQIALPLLYREISINVNDWEDEQLENFLVHSHAGHRNIRSIDVDSDDIEGERKAMKVAKDILSVLPWNGLRAFRCPLEEGVDNDLIILLAARQRKLSSICIGPLQSNALNLVEAHKPWPSSVETIIVPWRLLSPRDYTFYHDLIRLSQKRLKALTVRVNDFAWHWKGQPNTSEELVRGLFGHEDGTTYSRRPLELRDINFQNQDLLAFDETWAHYIDFSRLRTIQIWNCANTDKMLECLIGMAKSQPLRLEGLVLSYEEWAQAPKRAGEFLRSISGLNYLNLCLNRLGDEVGQSSFDLKCLSGHFHTLQDVYIGIGTNLTRGQGALWMPSEGEIRLLATRCQRLKQLAIALPPISIDDVLTGRLGKYFTYLKYLANLPRLKILRILTWPIDCNDRLDYLWWRHKQRLDAYLPNLDIVADTIVRLFAHYRHEVQAEDYDRLSVLTFGSAERGDRVQVPQHGNLKMDKPVTYKVRRVWSEFGWLLETDRVQPGEMKYEEPIAYVFDEDTDQGLSLESYPWGCSDW